MSAVAPPRPAAPLPPVPPVAAPPRRAVPPPPPIAARAVVSSARPGARLLDSDVAAIVAAVVVLVVGTWWRHGGLAALGQGWEPAWSSVTQLSGLGASAVGLAGLALVARPRLVERRYGLDRLFVWHRVLGESMAVLVGVHVAAALAAAVPGLGVLGAVSDLTGAQPYLAGATVGALLVGVVTVSSLRSVRHHLSYETWYFVHLTAYLGLALAFGHQLALGTDLASDSVARWVWVALHVGVLALLVWCRWGRAVVAGLRPLRVAAVTPVGPGTAAVTLSGTRVRRLGASAGQFFLLRPLRRDLWWQAHPYSLSAAPSGSALRFTVKARGDASAATVALPVGTKVAVEGPYGACTPEALRGRPVLFVAGGVGVAPVRAMVEALDASAAPVVLYRAHREADLVHLDELRALTAARGGRVLTLVGPRAALAAQDPFGAHTLRAALPDLAERAAVLCGPDSLVHAARAGLRAAGIPADRIHFERSWW